MKKDDKRSLSLLQSLLSLLLFLILSGAEAPRLEKPTQKKNRDGVDGHSPTSLPGTLSITLPATHCSIFKSHSHIFSSPPPFSCFRPSPPSLSPLSLFFSLSVCYRSLLDSGQDTVFQLTWIAAPPVGLQPSRCSLTCFGCVLTQHAHTQLTYRLGAAFILL